MLSDANRSTENTDNGFWIGSSTGGTIFGNIAGVDMNGDGVLDPMDDSGNGTNGFWIDQMTGGMLDNNVAVFSGENGFVFDSGITGGSVTQNQAISNTLVGFLFNDDVVGNTTQIEGNAAVENGSHGFHFVADFGMDATLDNNNAFRNGGHGFFFDGEVFGGEITDNNASNGGLAGEDGNAMDGFHFDLVSNGLIDNNTARFNVDDGFEFVSATGGTITNNLAENNQDDGFIATLNDSVLDAVFDGNESNNNMNDGYQINDMRMPAVTGETNTGAGNGANNTFNN